MIQLAENHPQLVDRLGALFTKKLAVSTAVLEMARFGLGGGVSMARISGLLEALARTEYFHARLGYAKDILAWMDLPSADQEVANCRHAAEFGTFEDRGMYAGKFPSSQYLVSLSICNLLGGKPRVCTQVACT
jgi:hypothetical protein